MDKKGDMPYWLVMTILTLIGLIIAILIIAAVGGKLQDFIAWLWGIW